MSAYSMGGGMAPRNQVTQRNGNERNPLNQNTNKWNRWNEPQPVAVLGSTPGLMEYYRAPGITAFGVIRRMWKQSVNDIGASPYSWLTMRPGYGRPISYGRAIGVTRAWRYLCSSLYMQAGADNTAFRVAHTEIIAKHKMPPVTVGAGTMSGRPVIRNRMSSFGSRVPPLNQRAPAATKSNNRSTSS